MVTKNKADTSIQNGLRTLFEGLDKIMDDEAAKDYDAVKDLLKVDVSSPEQFWHSFTYPVSKVISTLIKQEAVHKEELLFLYKRYSYINSHFRELFSNIEGGPCCADKSRTMILCLANYFKTGKDFELNYNQEYTFHLPNKILKTQEDILEYFNALWALYYGHSEKYLHQTIKIMQSIKAEKIAEQNRKSAESAVKDTEVLNNA